MENAEQNCLFLKLSRLLAGDDSLCAFKAREYFMLLTENEDYAPLLDAYVHILSDLGILAELCLVNIEEEITERLFHEAAFKPQLSKIMRIWQTGPAAQMPVMS